MARFPKLKLGIELEIPERIPDLVTKRDHNRLVKESLEDVLRRHHALRIPKHFEAGAHDKYHYKQRSEKYQREKARRYGSTEDLVKTGKSRRRILGEPEIHMGGAATGGKHPIVGRMTMRFNFRGGGGRRYTKPPSPESVQIEQMHRELKAITPDERREIAAAFKANYKLRFEAYRAGKKRIRAITT